MLNRINVNDCHCLSPVCHCFLCRWPLRCIPVTRSQTCVLKWPTGMRTCRRSRWTNRLSCRSLARAAGSPETFRVSAHESFIAGTSSDVYGVLVLIVNCFLRWSDGSSQDDLLRPWTNNRLWWEDSAWAGLQRHAGDFTKDKYNCTIEMINYSSQIYKHMHPKM